MTERLSKIFDGNKQPSEFMRARRPELFSDSTAYDEAVYPRSVFDYFLNTLTSRNEERLFEVFTRRLAEREVCPNLVPQTGPVGGGDSKVDSETYPVADELASTWYHNDAVSAAREKWAFAISAKRDWRPKVQSDVRKIAGTGRGYTNIFFITSQYVPDKARGELQDSLSLECGAKVTIFDRGWILEKTYGNRHLDLVFEVFSIAPDPQRLVRQGPADVKRETALADLDKRISDVASYAGSKYRRAEDALEAALLSRALGRSSPEVDGRFTRAVEMVSSGNVGQHLLRFKYLQAWTRFWWFDDADGAESLYDAVVAEAKKDKNAWHIERALNLWFCLLSATKSGRLSPAVACLETRARELEDALLEIQELDSGSTNSLFARSQLVFLRLALRLPDGPIDDLLTELRDVVTRAGNHMDFPMDSLSQVLQELGTMLEDSDALDDVLDLVLSATEPRASHEVSADALVERAERKLRTGKPYDAISLLGRTIMRLKSTEARREMLVAMGLLAAAYERVGLLWAARGMLLLALERGLRPLREEGVLSEICASLMRRVCWIEMQLGRPTSVLRSVEVANLYQLALGTVAEASEPLREEEMMRNVIFGILILRTPLSELERLRLLPGILGHPRLNLSTTRAAALYALGYDDAVVYESGIQKNELGSFFEMWVDQPAADDLPEVPNWHLGRTVRYRTHIVGCEIQLEIEVDYASILFAESLLPAVEAYAATSLRAGLYPTKSLLRCRATPADGSGHMFHFESVEDEYGDISIDITFDPLLVASRDFLASSSNDYFELVSYIVHNAMMSPSEESVQNLLGDGEAVTRTGLFLGLPVVDGIVFGDDVRLSVDDWAQRLEVTESFQMLRSTAWDHGRVKRVTSAPVLTGSDKPCEPSRQDGLKHTQVFVGDVINISLWDRAKWRGTLAQVEHDGALVVGLLFEDIEAGKKIFRGLRNRLGPVDAEDRLQVAFLTGINADAPQDYRVLLAPNRNLLTANSNRRTGFMLTRTNTMNTQNTVVLDLLSEFQVKGSTFRLAPCVLNARGQPQVLLDYAIQKFTLSVVPAWTVGESSPWLLALRPDDEVLIPQDIVDPPVKAALARLASCKK